MQYKNQPPPYSNGISSNKPAVQAKASQRTEHVFEPKNRHTNDEKLEKFQDLMRKENVTKESEKDTLPRGEFSMQEQHKTPDTNLLQIDKVFNNLSESKKALAHSVPSDTTSKLAELVQGLVSKLWVNRSEGAQQNALILKVDNAFLQNTTIKVSHNHGLLSVQFSTSSEASYQLIMSQQRQLTSRLEKRKYAEKVDVGLDLNAKEIDLAPAKTSEDEAHLALTQNHKGSGQWI